MEFSNETQQKKIGTKLGNNISMHLIVSAL